MNGNCPQAQEHDFTTFNPLHRSYHLKLPTPNLESHDHCVYVATKMGEYCYRGDQLINASYAVRSATSATAGVRLMSGIGAEVKDVIGIFTIVSIHGVLLLQITLCHNSASFSC